MSISIGANLDERAAYLGGSGVWSALSTAVLQEVAAAMRPRAYRSGEFMIRQGEPGRYLHVLVSGSADVQMRASNGTLVSVATMSAGACFGEMSLLSGDLTSADVVATADCETLTLDRPAFDALVAAQPQLLREFVRMVSQRLKDSNAAMGAAREKEKELTRFLQEANTDDDVIGTLPAARALQRRIDAEASLDGPVLVQGERGTGKELVARLVHFRSARRNAPLLCTDCVHIAETPWGDKLFGEYRQAPGGPPPAVSYLDLARGGTVVLKNVDSLPRAIQDRLASYIQTASQHGAGDTVRIVATCHASFHELAAAGRVSPALAQALGATVLDLPPLRECKRDIPAIARHLVQKHALRLGKPVPALSDRALAKLVTHDYRQANVRELEEALQRAVILTDAGQIEPEVIFVGQPPAPSRWAFNLLLLPRPVVRWALALFPGGARAAMAVTLALVMYQAFFVPAGRDGNLALAVWAIGWPVLVASFLVAGRACCAVCPMPIAGDALQRVLGRNWPIPGWIKRRDGAILMSGFFLVIWAEEVTGMRHSPFATGVLLAAIGAGAVITSVLLPRRAWCRHLCPMGGLAGVSAMTALVELRPTADICAAKCRDHACFKGGGGVAGCPLFNHVMFVDSNRHCVLCLNCVRTCRHDSPQVNLRLPAADLVAAGSEPGSAARWTVLLAGLLAAVVLIHYAENMGGGPLAALLRDQRVAVVTILLTVAAVIPQGLLSAVARHVARRNATTEARFWQYVSAWLPLVTAGFACYQLAFVPVLSAARVTIDALSGRSGGSISFPLLLVLQAGILCSGLIVAIGVWWVVRRRGVRAAALPVSS